MSRVVPHDFWYRADVANDLATFDLPAVLAKVGAEPGWSQDALAKLLGYSRPTLNKVVNGVRPLRVDEAKRLVQMLSIPPHLIGIGPSDEEVRATDRRQFGQVTAGALVMPALPSGARLGADEIRTMTRKFAALERERGGNSLLPALTRQASVWLSQVRDVHSRSLVSAFGEFCGLTGYAHYDAQKYRLADHYYTMGLQAAYEAGDPVLTAQIRALMSQQATWLDNGNEGGSHCTAVLHTVRRIPPIERSMLLGRQARADALLGERSRVHRLIEMSQQLRSEQDARQPAIAYWSDTEKYGNFGIAYKDIGEYAAAEQYLRAAVQAAGRVDPRDAALYLGVLSRLLIKTNRYEEAAATAREILATPVMSTRTEKQLKLFRVKTKSITEPTVRHVREEIRARLAS